MTDNINQHRTNWFKGLDSLRFILALIVLLSHFNNPYTGILKSSPHQALKFFAYFLANAFDGTAAVICFFIISGFVIHYPNKNKVAIDLKTFWLKRFTRILIPVFIIILIGIKYGHPEKAVIWSLICELAYYAIYPFLLKINLSWEKKLLVATLLSTCFICIGAKNDIVALVKQTDVNYHGYYWQMGPFLTWVVGLPVWLSGVVLANNIDKFSNVSISKIYFLRITTYIISFLLCVAKFHAHFSYILSMNVFAILLYVWLKNEIVYFKTRKPNGLLEQMGKFSYSLYLCHPLIYIILEGFISSSVITYPFLIIITTVIAYLFYLAVEKPSHQLALRLSKKHFKI